MSDFTNITDVAVNFEEIAQSDAVDFMNIGDEGVIVVVSSVGFGEGGFGDGPFGGGETTLIVSGVTTTWTNIETP